MPAAAQLFGLSSVVLVLVLSNLLSRCEGCLSLPGCALVLAPFWTKNSQPAGLGRGQVQSPQPTGTAKSCQTPSSLRAPAAACATLSHNYEAPHIPPGHELAVGCVAWVRSSRKLKHTSSFCRLAALRRPGIPIPCCCIVPCHACHTTGGKLHSDLTLLRADMPPRHQISWHCSHGACYCSHGIAIAPMAPPPWVPAAFCSSRALWPAAHAHTHFMLALVACCVTQ